VNEPTFPRTPEGDEVRMLAAGPGFGRVVATRTEGGKRRVVDQLGMIETAPGGGWATRDLRGGDYQRHATQREALERFAAAGPRVEWRVDFRAPINPDAAKIRYSKVFTFTFASTMDEASSIILAAHPGSKIVGVRRIEKPEDRK
jgi:hypothetical protein